MNSRQERRLNPQKQALPKIGALVRKRPLALVLEYRKRIY